MNRFHNFKKFFSLFVAFVLILSMLSMTYVSAEDPSWNTPSLMAKLDSFEQITRLATDRAYLEELFPFYGYQHPELQVMYQNKLEYSFKAISDAGLYPISYDGNELPPSDISLYSRHSTDTFLVEFVYEEQDVRVTLFALSEEDKENLKEGGIAQCISGVPPKNSGCGCGSNSSSTVYYIDTEISGKTIEVFHVSYAVFFQYNDDVMVKISYGIGKMMESDGEYKPTSEETLEAVKKVSFNSFELSE